MGKVKMKETDYYKSGKHAEHNRKISAKGAKASRAKSQKRKDEYAVSPNKCSLCEKELEYNKRYNKYCGSSCAATANNIKRTAKASVPKASVTTKSKPVYKPKHKGVPAAVVDFEFMKKLKKAKKDRRLLDCNWDSISWEKKRERVILEQFGKCNHCGITVWQGKRITLEIDHIDGNNKNNERDNLEGLCPNCHSITDTWRGRNKAQRQKPYITEEQRVQAYLETGNIHCALIKLGIAPKGTNYRYMKQALTKWGIEY